MNLAVVSHWLVHPSTVCRIIKLFYVRFVAVGFEGRGVVGIVRQDRRGIAKSHRDEKTVH